MRNRLVSLLTPSQTVLTVPTLPSRLDFATLTTPERLAAKKQAVRGAGNGAGVDAASYQQTFSA